MRPLQRLACTAALLVFCLPPAVYAQSDTHAFIEALLNRVVDGSTLDTQIHGARTPVGYLGISVPDLNQPCGQEAFQRNRELTASGVLLQVDPLYSFDDRHRALFYAFTADGTSIDDTLIAEGLAHAVRTDASRGPAEAALEADAAAQGMGCLWSNPT